MNAHLALRTGRAVIATILLLLALAMLAFEKTYFPFTPFSLYVLGLFIGLGIIDVPQKNTLKEILYTLLICSFIAGAIIVVHINLPWLHHQPYKSMFFAMWILLHLIILWWQWHKGTNKKRPA